MPDGAAIRANNWQLSGLLEGDSGSVLIHGLFGFTALLNARPNPISGISQVACRLEPKDARDARLTEIFAAYNEA